MRFPKQKQLIQLLSNKTLKCKCKWFATKALPCAEAIAGWGGDDKCPRGQGANQSKRICFARADTACKQ